MTHADTIESDPFAAEPPGNAPVATVTGGDRRAVGLLTRFIVVVGALLMAGTSVIHLHLWMTGYRHIATIGPLFLVQAVGGFVLAVVVAVWPRWYVAAAGALFLLATAGGLIFSTQVSLFGFKDSFGAPYAGMALILEGTGAVILAVVAGLTRVHGGKKVCPTSSGAGRASNNQ